VGDRTSRVLTDRRQLERRRQQDRRNARLDGLLKELQPLRAALKENSDRICKLEDEQHVQLVRISQIQRELDDLKKSRPG
jgi:uncharacterized coiled-coil DUF342 family protein